MDDRFFFSFHTSCSDINFKFKSHTELIFVVTVFFFGDFNDIVQLIQFSLKTIEQKIPSELNLGKSHCLS